VRCPFNPPCEADLEPVEQMAAPGSSRREYVYPVHTVEGVDSWFGTCPASHFLILPDGRITDYAQGVLKDASRVYLHMVLDQLKRAGKLKEPPSITREELDRALGRDVDRPRDEYFPGRPGDAPEPGPGEKPTQNVPLDIGGGALGRSQMDNARDQLHHLTGAAITEIGRLQDTLARATATLDIAEGLIDSALIQAESSMALIRAAVGGAGGALPDSAQKLVQQGVVGSSTLSDSADGVKASLLLTKERVRSAYASWQAAVDAGRDYQTIS
jgi:hypothetical protein